MANANLTITRILMILPSVSLGFLLGPIVKITGVLSPGNKAHPPGGHQVGGLQRYPFITFVAK
jgi:hypothetical protein